MRTTLLAGTTALLFQASAATFDGWYIGFEGGANWIGNAGIAYDLDVNVNNVTSDLAEASFETGWAAFATAGYAFTNNWRLEIEAGYRSNDASARFVVSDTFRQFEADVDEFSLMANVHYDIPLSARWRLSLGAGAGGDYLEIDARSKLNAAPTWDTMSAEDWRFAAQGIGGLSFALSPRTEMSLTYRYLHVSPPALRDVDLVTAGITSVETIGLDDLAKHSLTLGLRFDLAADDVPPAPPPSAPPPPPPPPAVKQFIVFFGFDRCDITDEADRVLGEAAAAAKASGAAGVRIAGHTDTSGSPAYNQRLSECRANAAKANLVAKGISDGSISTSGRGESELMVQTGDGVKEPQNRRATVDLN
jgi:outer membrane protein OmpA-like peptidoglycan-associated protein